ncbi:MULTISPECIES: MarR family winged helix-turn-helix transcriptional regulator [Gordonia]|uniref:MarR family transcriptional regulator n=2 Tax=Gordonia terrae TaxID=2055 RepID=A0A2I1R9I9_9ACTN|nr:MULTISPECIES: MarR family winged helix-turn-helix transcriptional regulator [Gordonia]VTR08380.1 MarR-family transcriptional regulator [Clostridioides difficile]ANY25452.1 MarR family transcriptional regulator [Gordonia terrae]AWO86199.1 MarR family transcriptional regulator [Gordonia terrae]MCG7633521.1 MarR family winged helix-turn-helix transcriptional regulator [Gordonia sp. McavH-238-E]PKZ65784.1 MarR family transcriptional regulator [Gordonia terrae]
MGSEMTASADDSPGPDPVGTDPISTDPISGLEAELTDFWRRGRVRTRLRARAIDPRLDPSCYPLITVLAKHNSMPMSDLVTAVGMEKSTVTRQIDAIVRLGLAERHPDPRDARARVVTLTQHGRERVDAVLASAITEWRARLAQWDPDDIRSLTHLLHRLTEATNDPEAREGPR